MEREVLAVLPRSRFTSPEAHRVWGSVGQSPVWDVVYGCLGTELPAAIKFFHPGEKQKC